MVKSFGQLVSNSLGLWLNGGRINVGLSHIDVRNEADYSLSNSDTALIIPTIIEQQGNISYNALTGEITFLKTGLYWHNLMLNASSSAAREIYTYASLDRAGSGHHPITWSGRVAKVRANERNQILFASINKFLAGDKIKFHLWADSAIQLTTFNLPGITREVIKVPSVRLLYGNLDGPYLETS